MSQIFAPGSVAGPAGPAGAAGSLANIKTLTDSVLPNMGNLFDYTRTVFGKLAVDGTVAAGGFSIPQLVYCPGALYAITDIPIRLQDNDNYFAFYDANGNFISSTTSFAGVNLVNTNYIPVNTVFPLPGTQTYVRFPVHDGLYNQGTGDGKQYASSAATASFYAGVTQPSIPASYQPFGFDTVGSVNTKIANIASNSSVYDAQLLKQIGGGPLGMRNVFNYRDVLLDYSMHADGTVGARSGWSVATVYAPNSTSMITNIPFIASGYDNAQVCAYDAAGNFIANITSSLAPYIESGQGRVIGNVTIPLSGKQTYIKFTYLSGWFDTGSSNNWGGSPRSGVFYSGTVADPPPSSLTALNYSLPCSSYRSVTIKTATELGAPADQLRDSTAVLNAFLATASAANPIELVLDGMFATTGLILSTAGYTTIRGLGRGTGLFLVGGTAQDGIRIGPYTQVGAGNSEGLNAPTAPARTATNICLRDFTLDPRSLAGQGGQQAAGQNQPYAGDIAHDTYGIIFTNATEILVDNVEVKQADAYALGLSNVSFVKVTNCKFYSGGYLHDGIHIDGPSEDIGIMNCDFGTGDDAIALNAPEGYGGEISRVTVTNCRFNGSLSVMRIYTSVDATHMPSNNTRSARDIVVSNCTGYIRGIGFVIGIWGGGYSSTTSVDQIQDLLVTNCTIVGDHNLMAIHNTCGAVTLRGVNFIPTGTDPVIDVAYQTGKLIVDGVYILRNPIGNAAPVSLIGVGAPLGHLYVDNCGVIDEDGSSYTTVACLLDLGPTVGVLELGTVDLTHVTSLVSSVNGWSHVTTVRGSGVIGSGSQVPDSVMDNNALYLSSNAGGAPSIKVGGTAKRLTLA